MQTFIEQWFSSGLVISLASNGNLAGDLHNILIGYEKPLVTHSNDKWLVLINLSTKASESLQKLSMPDVEIINQPPWVKTWLKQLRYGCQRICCLSGLASTIQFDKLVLRKKLYVWIWYAVIKKRLSGVSPNTKPERKQSLYIALQVYGLTPCTLWWFPTLRKLSSNSLFICKGLLRLKFKPCLRGYSGYFKSI